MATAGDVIETALKRILVQASDAPLEPDEYADGLEALNNYMAALEADHLYLGYTEVDNVADTVTVHKGALRGIIANLAIEVAPDYGGKITSLLQEQARKGMQTMRRLGMPDIEATYPSTMPIGSGNEDTYLTQQYYADASAALVTLNGNTEATAMTVTDTAYKVDGQWSIDAVNRYRAVRTGTITNLHTEDVDADITITGFATGSSTYTFRLMKNGVSQATQSIALTSTPAAISITKFLTLEPGDYLELFVEDDLATASVTVTQCQFKVA